MKNIYIYSNRTKSGVIEAEKTVKARLSEYGFRVTTDEKEADAVIVLGGDGTILSAAKYGKPILGINLGNIGFMSELEASELELLKLFAEGKYTIENRMMLDIKLKNSSSGAYTALNEAAVTRGATSKMIEFRLKCDGEDVSVYSADGIIICTPTGSTAYSMAAGGPIIDPKLEALCATPVCSHSLLDARPLLFSPKSKLEIIPENESNMLLVIDGRLNIELGGRDSVEISKSDKKTRLIRLQNHSFSDVLFKKLSKRL